MKLHQNRVLFQDAILATAQSLNIPEIYIEKDYWVTVALYEIFHSSFASEAVFKGGTALSKCHKLIERFSEDIDVVVVRSKGETDNQLKKKIRRISKIVGAVIPEVDIEGLTNKKGNIRKTVHQYTKVFKGNFGQVNEHIILETSWLGNFEPFTQEHIGSYITNMMLIKGQLTLIEKYNMSSFMVQVLSTERTFCEKIMSLVRFSQKDNPYTELSNKIRHIYDIHMMLKNERIRNFFESNNFNTMLLKVGHDDALSYKNKNEWLQKHPSEAIIFNQPKETWNKIRTSYKLSFKELVIGKLPDELDLIDTLQKVAEKLETIYWDIE